MLRWLGCSVLLLSLSGCSALFVSGPPAEHAKLSYFDCDSSAAGPVSDVTWAILEGLIFASAASASGDEDAATGVAAIFGVAAAAHIGSAIYGVVNINACNRAKELLRQRLANEHAEHDRAIIELQRLLDAQAAGNRPPPRPVGSVEAGALEQVPTEPTPATPTLPTPPPAAETAPTPPPSAATTAPTPPPVSATPAPPPSAAPTR